jgi:predicted transcriptional regulator
LQEQAYIERRQHDGNAEYCLTADGEDLVRILGEINRMYRRRKNRNE